MSEALKVFNNEITREAIKTCNHRFEVLDKIESLIECMDDSSDYGYLFFNELEDLIDEALFKKRGGK